jgi:mono/diheme cytochrome c family protein
MRRGLTTLPALALLVSLSLCSATLSADTTAPAGKTVTTPLYTVKDGNKVDANTLAGWKTWRAMACDRCHGPTQEGLVGPSLIEAFKTITKEKFHNQLMKGSPEKGMPPFATSDMINKNWEYLYGYLKGRSDGNILPGHLYPIDDSSANTNAK